MSGNADDDDDNAEAVTPPPPELSPEDIPEVEPAQLDELDTRPLLEEKIKAPLTAKGEHEETEIPAEGDAGDGANEGEKNKSRKAEGSDKMEGKISKACPPPRSRCRARSRDTRQCKQHFKEMIGKYENRNDELEQRETDLRQRLEMLECSMPAVMVWNIWRMAQGAPVSHLRDVVEKQFLEPATGFPKCPSSPSQHWDCRVREVEAERKQARHRAEQARQVFAAKGEALEVQKRRIEEARKLQEERKLQIAGLEEEVKQLKDKLKNAQGDENSCQTGECGEIKCRDAWLQGAASVSSVHSTDLECLARLQDLAEAELCMKRQIADLERRECAYMRTLQQADEMWAKMEGDNASSLGDLRDQLESKIAANQQLADRIVELEDEIEKLKMQLSKAAAALDEYAKKSFADVALGDVDVSTEEKIEQTDEDVVKFFTDEGEKLMEKSAVKSEVVEVIPKSQDEDARNTMTIEEIVEPYDENIESQSVISTAEESVQVKPEIEDIGTQSSIEEANSEKETSLKVKTPSIDENAAAVPELSKKYSPEENEDVVEIRERKSVASAAEKLHSVEDKGSLAHLLKPPTEDKDTGVSIAENSADNLIDKNNPIEATLEESHEATVELSPASVVPETAIRPVIESVAESPPKTALETIVETPSVDADYFSEEVLGIPLPESPVQTAAESLIEVTVKASPEPKAESMTEAIASPILVPALEAVEAPATELQTPEAAAESDIQNSQVEITLPEVAFTVSPGTLVAWHNVAACVHRLISVCPRCSSSIASEVENMLKEMREFLGEDAPDLAKIECPQDTVSVEHSIPVPQKKGPCICKPKTCPLERTPAGAPPLPQNSVQVQTVVDGQSQTSVLAKIPTPTRGARSPRSSKGSTKTRDEVKFTSIEEGTETDIETPRARSISGARDEATVTVGDIASQTEAVRRVSSETKDGEEKTCVCPTGVCPKKNPKPPFSRGETKPGKSFTVGRRSQSKEYRSTVDAILAPAITVLSTNETDSSPPITRSKITNDTSSESGSKFACYLCGKVTSSVASMKSTSAKSFTQSSGVKLSSEISEDDFLCCACKSRATRSAKPKTSVLGKSSEKLMHSEKVSSKANKPVSGRVKTSCSREVCCPCSKESETHVVITTQPLSDGSEFLKSKIKPETKDVCCLAKISRDKVSRTEERRRKDKDSVKVASSTVSYSGSAQMSATSSSYKSPGTKESSDSNVCCSSIEQVVSMMKKKVKGTTRCACTSDEDKDRKGECVCGENGSEKPNEPLKIKQTDSKLSNCLCSPPRLFDEY